MSLPGVDELFRSSSARPVDIEPEEETYRQVVKEAPVVPEAVVVAVEAPQRPIDARIPEPEAQADGDAAGAGRRPRHEEKVTFYCTASDLTRIERARLALRSDHKLASDRGRIVRAALAEILDDFDAHGSASALVRRLRDGQRL